MGETVWWWLSTDSQAKVDAIVKKWEDRYKPELDTPRMKSDYGRKSGTCRFERHKMQTTWDIAGIKTFDDLESRIHKGEIVILTKMPDVKEFASFVQPGPKYYVVDSVYGENWLTVMRQRGQIEGWGHTWVYPGIYFGPPIEENFVEGRDFLSVPYKGFVQNTAEIESIVIAFAQIEPDKWFANDLCKTQPFRNEQVEGNAFAHMLLCDFLHDVKDEDLAFVHVNDEAEYYDTGDYNVLLRNFGAGYDVIQRVGGMLAQAGWKTKVSHPGATLPNAELLLNLIPVVEPVEERVLKIQIRNSLNPEYDVDSPQGEEAFRESITGLIAQGKIFCPKPGFYQLVESPQVVDVIKNAIRSTQAKLDEFQQLQKLGPALSQQPISRLWDIWSPQNRKSMLIDARYPFPDVVMNKPWSELQESEKTAIEKAWKTLGL